MPLFPLASVALMPHAVLPLHIFEPRYRKLVADALDGPGQIAMAMYDRAKMRGTGPRGEGRGAQGRGTGADGEEERPPLRQAVCVGQVVQHHRMGDGRYTIALHGICRARILTELPEESDVPYRQALLEPIGLDDGDPQTMAAARETLAGLLDAQPLAGLREAEAVGRHLRDDEIPATAVLELVAVTLLRDSEMRFYNELHYQLLAEGDPQRRARLIEERLRELSRLLTRALPQTTTDAPRGCQWN